MTRGKDTVREARSRLGKSARAHTIRRIALARIRGNRARSVVIGAAICLTMVLFMTVVSIAVHLVDGYGLMLRMRAGTDYHGYLRAATFSIGGEELRDAALASEDVAEAEISSNVARYAMREAEVPGSMTYLRVMESAASLSHFYTEITSGAFPADDMEILVDPAAFPDAALGDTIGLYYYCETAEAHAAQYAEFTVCGFLETSADSKLTAILAYSDTICATYGIPASSLNVYLRFRNGINTVGKYNALVNGSLAAYKLPEYTRYGGLNMAYRAASLREVLNFSTVLFLVFSVGVVFFCSFLVIYSVYSIALARDMQAFGLLRVLGTTDRQLRQVIRTESAILYAAAALPGIALGYAIGWRLLAPLLSSALSDIGMRFSFHAWIPFAALALTWGTVSFSAARPLHRLARLTPIATLDAAPEQIAGKGKKRSGTVNPVRMAWYAVLRSRRKNAVTALSVVMAVLLFLLIQTACDYMYTYTMEELRCTDYTIKPTEMMRDSDDALRATTAYADNGLAIVPEYCAAVAECASAARVYTVRTVMVEMDTPDAVREALGRLQTEYKWFDLSPELGNALAGRLDVLVVSVPDVFFAQIQRTAGEVFGVDYADGTYAVYDGAQTVGITDSAGNPTGFAYFREGDTVTLGGESYKVACSDAVGPTTAVTGWIQTVPHRAVLYLPESAFLRSIGEGAVYALLVDAVDGGYASLRTELDGLAERFSVTQSDVGTELPDYMTALQTGIYEAAIDGRMDGMERTLQTIRAMQTVGYSLAAMIFTFGALHIVNTACTTVTERRREFALLEAVGMTGRQLRRMLLAESLCGGFLAALLTCAVGIPVTQWIVVLAMHHTVRLRILPALLMLASCLLLSVSATLITYYNGRERGNEGNAASCEDGRMR